MKQVRNKFTDQEFIDLYNEHKHLGKIAVSLKIPMIQAWRIAKKLGLPFGGGGGVQKKIPLDEILAGDHPYFQTNKLRKKLLKEGIFNNKCSCCGISEWNNKEITMHLDHIDGDSSNHKKDNLRMLCPNCHSQTDTWCGRNKTTP
jgi:hypothetical protein